jgi:hypothetical protein
MKRLKLELEAEKSRNEDDLRKTNQIHYNNTMELMREAKNQEEFKRRHEKEQEINTSLIDKKKTEKDALLADLENLKTQFEGMGDL